MRSMNNSWIIKPIAEHKPQIIYTKHKNHNVIRPVMGVSCHKVTLKLINTVVPKTQLLNR